ncbi:MAG: ABC transporter permease [Alphaproteobacteria bacterium]|nr:ABC transporter permease [Alphaproteobacteria bacterium]
MHDAPRLAAALARRALDFLLLTLAVLTLLFVALRVTGDPAIVIAGEDADAETLQAVQAQYGFDQPIPVQYARYLGDIVRGEFGDSLASGQPALQSVLDALPNTVLLALLALLTAVICGQPLGLWLGTAPERAGRRMALGAIVFVQSVPGIVVALLLIQLFAVSLNWLPAFGAERPSSWIMPTLTLAALLVPKLARVVAANVTGALGQDYVRTARAAGLAPARILWRHVLPNALLGAVALLGAQFAFLVSGAVVTETIFGWPGLGRLLVQSTLNLDFPVVQALVLVICLLVFVAGALTDVAIRLLDPRIRAA